MVRVPVEERTWPTRMDRLSAAYKQYVDRPVPDWVGYERAVEKALRWQERVHEAPPYEALFGTSNCTKHLYPMGMNDYIWKQIDGEVRRCCIDCGEVL